MKLSKGLVYLNLHVVFDYLASSGKEIELTFMMITEFLAKIPKNLKKGA